MYPVKIAIVGLGGFARTYLRDIHGVAGFGQHVAQVAIEADQRTFGAEIEALIERGVKIFSSLREMLAAYRDEIDLVCIPTGIPLHRAMTIAALEAGCHVLVEKPAAGSIQDVDAMLAAQARSGRMCAVGYQHLSQPSYQLVKNWICAGHLGRIGAIKACGCWPRDPAYYNRNGWAGKMAVGDTWVLDSPHNNALAHAVNAMCFLACQRHDETLKPVAIRAELYRANPIESADTAVFRVHTAEETEIFFAVSHCSEELVAPRYEICGELGRIEMSYEGDAEVVWNDGRREGLVAAKRERALFADVVRAASVENGKPAASLAMARAQTLCACGTFESSAIGEIPTALRRVDAESGQVAVPGMTEWVQAAYESASLFSELDIGWAIPGERIDLEGYGYFPSFRAIDNH